jgi:hypothetical protein
VVVMAALCRDAATVQAQITDVNVGSAPDATDGDTIRNAFIKCNNDFTYIGGQLNTINSTLSGFSTEYDPYGTAFTVGFWCTNYTRYVVGTNTVAWLGCLNAESNVLQNDITALTNNVNSLWSALGGSGGLLHSGGQMAFDQMTAPPYPMQIYSDGNGNLTVDGSIKATYLLDSYSDTPAAGYVATSQGTDGTWEWQAIPLPTGFSEYTSGGILFANFAGNFQTTYLSDSYSDTPAAGYVATSQGTDGTWQWQALPAFPTTLNFDSGNITSDGDGNASFVSIHAQQLQDSGGGTGSSGYFAQADGSGGWSWTAWPATLNYDAGDITSDGAGNIAATGFRGSLLDNGDSSGASGSVLMANGDGSWTWTQGSVVPDSGGNGGTCLHLKASDNGQDMYLHVDSSGVITATTSP